MFLISMVRSSREMIGNRSSRGHNGIRVNIFNENRVNPCLTTVITNMPHCIVLYIAVLLSRPDFGGSDYPHVGNSGTGLRGSSGSATLSYFVSLFDCLAS